MTDTLLIDTPSAFDEAVSELCDSPHVAIDIEANGMHAYRTDLCVIQLCAAESTGPSQRVFVIDTLAFEWPPGLRRLLECAATTIVLHDVSFDARMLRAHGCRLHNIVDTAVAARFAGAPATGLASLLAVRAGVQLDKKLQHHDWSRRPIDATQLAYLSADVAYLGVLAASLAADVAALGIEDEVRTETTYLLETIYRDAPEAPAYARLKGAQGLPPVERAILRELFDVRERAAERMNAPIGRVTSNASLVAVARLKPKDIAAVRRVGQLHGPGASVASALLAAIQKGAMQEDVPVDERRWFARETPSPEQRTERKRRELALGAWRKAEAAQRGVDLQVVLPGHAMAALVASGADSLDALAAVHGLGDVRVARYGEALLNVLRKPTLAPDDAIPPTATPHS